MPKMIELEEVQRLLGEGAQILDVMSRSEYEESHIPGAVPNLVPDLVPISENVCAPERTGNRMEA
jgi:rhodanese-related sulfurtransferase